MSRATRYRRPSTPVFTALGVLGALALAEAGHALVTAPHHAARLAEVADTAARLGLTDLALFTEARYTRHPALADLATAFQDAPGSFEHFPSGSFLPPPAHLRAETALGFAPAEVAR